MAKGNLFLGQARGRVGSVVFSRRLGQQISRTYNSAPANPKTRAQALQRAQFATVIAASQVLKEVINNSFDGKKNGQESVNAFVSANLNDIRTRGNAGDFTANEWLVPKGESFIQPQPWIVSKGSIGTIKPYMPALGPDFDDNLDEENPYMISQVEKWDSWYYAPGTQWTFVALNYEVDENNNGFIKPIINRLVFSKNAPTDKTTVLFKADETGTGIVIDAAYCDLTKTDLPTDESGAFGLTKAVQLPLYLTARNASGALQIDTLTGNFSIVAFAIIVTKIDENGNYKHTTSYMDINSDIYDYTTDAVATYMTQAISKIRSSDYYTEQPEGSSDDAYYMTLNEAVSAVISAQGMTEKGVYIGQTNSYGPVAEGATVGLTVVVPQNCVIVKNSVKAYNGETALGDDWQIVRFSNNRVIITGPMPTTTTFAFNVSFDVWDNYDGSTLGRAALRINVSKANS